MDVKLDPIKLADAQDVANKLASLPRDALLYISGYVEGHRDAIEGRMQDRELSPAMRDSA